MSQIWRSACIPSAAASSIRPRNGDTMYAPISAARMAWAGENTSVTLIRTPSPTSRLPVSSPSGVMGTLTTALGPIEASRCPSSYMARASGSVVSRETSPSTSVRISFHTCSGSNLSLKIRVGFVVTPDSTPHRLISRISSMLAVSRNSLTSLPSLEFQAGLGVGLEPGGGPVHDQIDDRSDGLIEVVRGDHRPVVGQGLALDIPLNAPDVVEIPEVVVERAGRGVRGPGGEVAPVQLLVLHGDDQGDGQDPLGELLDVQEPGDHVGALDDQAGPLHRRPLDQGPEPHRHGGGLFPKPHDGPVHGPRR